MTNGDFARIFRAENNARVHLCRLGVVKKNVEGWQMENTRILGTVRVGDFSSFQKLLTDLFLVLLVIAHSS